MNIVKPLKNKSIVIVTHEYTTGPPHSLEKYCIGTVSTLLFVSHPFIFAPDIRSYFRQYDEHGKMTETARFIPFFRNQFISIVKDVFLTLIWIIRRRQFDMYIGVDGINACTGIVLKKLGIVRHVVFYTIDYVPKRFSHSITNSLYLWIDKKAVEGSDAVWNLSETMKTMREEYGVSSTYRSKQIVVPVGTESDIPFVSKENIQRYHVAHMGHLTEKQGVQLVIQAIPTLVKKIPEFHFDIFGSGEYEKALMDLSDLLRVGKYITFHGYIENHKDLEIKLSKHACAIAPYVDTKDNFIRNTDPGKVKAYLSAGLPIVITKVPDVWKDIVENKCGIACDARPSSIARAIVSLLSDESNIACLRKNAYAYGKKFSWERVFEVSFTETLNYISKNSI